MARSSNTGRRVLATAAAVAIAAGTLVAAAGTATAADAPGVIAAKKAIKYASTYPTKIAITVPLTKRPPKGLKVFYIGASGADGARGANAFSAAATALGWVPTVLNFPANPADSVGLVQQAIQQGAKYIAVTGVDTKILQPGIDAAKAAGIPIFMNISDGVPAGAANGIYSSVNSATGWVYRGQLAAAQTTAYSNGKANVLMFNVPQFAIFQVWATSYKANLPKYCPGCVINGVVDAPYTDTLTGKASSAVIAYLRSHPEVNQIACSNGTFCTDLQAKAAAAGIKIGAGGIGMSVSAVNVLSLPQIYNKQLDSGLGSPLEYGGWQVADAMARQSVGNSLVPNWKARMPFYMWTQENTRANSQMYAGPINYTGQFKKLWKVS